MHTQTTNSSSSVLEVTPYGYLAGFPLSPYYMLTSVDERGFLMELCVQNVIMTEKISGWFACAVGES